MDEALYHTYSQSGGALPVFSGSRRHMVGGGFFGTLMRYAIPLIKNIGRRSLGAVSRGATQYLSGNKDLGSAMVDEFAGEAVDLAQDGVNRLRKRRSQTGTGRVSKHPKLCINKKHKPDLFGN